MTTFTVAEKLAALRYLVETPGYHNLDSPTDVTNTIKAIIADLEHLPALVRLAERYRCPHEIIITRAIVAVHNADTCEWCQQRRAALAHFTEAGGQ